MRLPSPSETEPLQRGPHGRRSGKRKHPRRMFARLVLLLVGMAWHTPSVRSQEASELQPFLDLETRFEETFEKINEPVAKLNTSYTEALQRLLSSETAAGKLEAALQIKAEIDGFGDGSLFEAASFQKRTTEHTALAGMRSKYLSERQRLRGLDQRSRADLAKHYQAALTNLEQEQTRLGNLKAALAARDARAALAQDPRFLEDEQTADGSRSFQGRIHLVAKGEVELRHNGTKLPLRNISRDRNKYADCTSEVVPVQVGNILVVKMRSNVVYRALILCIESEDGTVSVPVALDDYRYLGVNLPDKDLNLDAKAFEKNEMRPRPGTADADMAGMWNGKPLSTQSRAGSEWILSGPGTEWHSYAVMIREDMLLPVTND